MNPNQPIFSSIDYYKNPEFIELTRKWNAMEDAECIGEESIEFLRLWEQILIADYYVEAKRWLNEKRESVQFLENLKSLK